ncbi:large ribosomal subunit protein uL18m [Paramormyrops kingsleyae]|uniref:Large ribosomal subunit protein uL18m n=1 Tax=Paramormyrops kingsleyae TaxID=1676925 RepID=A0A3B3Q631_9TELE|nr:39S ribosomal protein L18, mitochondrial [Paramormyrops kingsleyae]
MAAVLGDLWRNVRVLLGQIQRQALSPAFSNTINGPFTKSARCMNQAAPQLQPQSDRNDNEDISKEFVNRNPRNLEQMALAVKDRGWGTVWPSNQYYHRLVFIRSQNYITAEIFAPHSSSPVLSCSSKEWALKRELASTNSVSASQAVGEVLAQRCREAGLLRLTFRVVPWTFRSESVKKFRVAMKGGGIKLCEPRRKYVG